MTGLATLGEDPQNFMFKFPGLLRNAEVLEKAAGGRGLLTIDPERDGIVRRVPMILLAQGTTMPSLSFEMLRLVTGTDTIFIKSDEAGIKSIGVKGFQIPTDLNGQLWVHFARHDPSIYVSAADVLDGSVAPEKIKGKLVLIGTSAAGLNDLKTTPVDPVMPGVEIHAQVLESRADACGAGAAELRPGARISCRADSRTSGDRVRAEIRDRSRWSSSARCSPRF